MVAFCLIAMMMGVKYPIYGCNTNFGQQIEKPAGTEVDQNGAMSGASDMGTKSSRLRFLFQ